MAIPKVLFKIATDALSRTARAIEKTPALVVTGATVADKVTLGESYQIFSLKQAEDLGIQKEGVNAFAYKHIKDFFDIAGQGAPLWFMLVSDATTMTAMFDQTNNYARKLIEDAKGQVRVVGGVKKATGTETITNGLDEDVTTAVVKAQELAEYFAAKYYPVRVVLSGNRFSGNVQDLKDYETDTKRHVNVLIANNDGSNEASIGLNLGRQVAIPSQRRQSRIKDGAVISLNAYFTNGTKVESLMESWDAIDDKRYTFFRSFPNRSGYFFTGDKTLVTKADDFSTLANGFVMDEAVLVAFNELVDELSDEIPIDTDGKIHPAIVKGWQGNIETAIEQQMKNQGKISGVKVLIDPNQNILQTNTLVVTIKIQPVGYADFIEVNIGFTTKLDN